MSPMADPASVAEGTPEGTQPGPSIMEDSDVEWPLVIDILNI